MGRLWVWKGWVGRPVSLDRENEDGRMGDRQGLIMWAFWVGCCVVIEGDGRALNDFIKINKIKIRRPKVTSG